VSKCIHTLTGSKLVITWIAITIIGFTIAIVITVIASIAITKVVIEADIAKLDSTNTHHQQQQQQLASCIIAIVVVIIS